MAIQQAFEKSLGADVLTREKSDNSETSQLNLYKKNFNPNFQKSPFRFLYCIEILFFYKKGIIIKNLYSLPVYEENVGLSRRCLGSKLKTLLT